jgi:hypothetical protein
MLSAVVALSSGSAGYTMGMVKSAPSRAKVQMGVGLIYSTTTGQLSSPACMRSTRHSGGRACLAMHEPGRRRRLPCPLNR